MTTKAFLPFALGMLCAAPLAAAEPAVELEPVDSDPCWRFSIGLRAAPGIRTSAAVDARAAAVAAGGVLRPAGRGGSSSKASAPTTSGLMTRVTTIERVDVSTEGTTEEAALAGAGYSPGRTRYEFDNGYVDLDDGAGIEGETQNWHFGSIDDFQDGALQARTGYSATSDYGIHGKVADTISVRETASRTDVARSVSFHEEWGELRGSSDETAAGLELRLDRTVWENADFGVDVGLGYAWYDDVDCLSIRGRAYSATATTRTETRKSSETRVTEVSGTATVDVEMQVTESGTVVTSLSQPEFTDPEDIRNPADNSIGGGIRISEDPPENYRTPVLTVTEDRFSTTVERNPTVTKTSVSASPYSIRGPVTRTYSERSTSSSSRTTRRTVDVRSEGTLSLQELRLGARPFWKATRWLSVRGDIGLLATYSELETETRLSVDGAPAAAIRRDDDDDWNLGGYAGLSLAAAATDRLEFSVGAEARFPHKSLRFDDGVVSGSLDLAEWSAFAAVALRF